MEIKCQLEATEVFIADLIACSTCFGHHYAHHQELIVQEVGWASGPVWTGAENLASPGFDPQTVQHVGSRYTDYATRPTVWCFCLKQMIIKLRETVIIYRNLQNGNRGQVSEF